MVDIKQVFTPIPYTFFLFDEGANKEIKKCVKNSLELNRFI